MEWGGMGRRWSLARKPGVVFDVGEVGEEEGCEFVAEEALVVRGGGTGGCMRKDV